MLLHMIFGLIVSPKLTSFFETLLNLFENITQTRKFSRWLGIMKVSRWMRFQVIIIGSIKIWPMRGNRSDSGSKINFSYIWNFNISSVKNQLFLILIFLKLSYPNPNLKVSGWNSTVNLSVKLTPNLNITQYSSSSIRLLHIYTGGVAIRY